MYLLLVLLLRRINASAPATPTQWWGLGVGVCMCNVDHGRRERGFVLIWQWRGRCGGEEIRNAKFSWRQFPFSHLSEVLRVVLRASVESSGGSYGSQLAGLQVSGPAFSLRLPTIIYFLRHK